MIIVDASVLTNALVDDGVLGQRARSELMRDDHWAGPEHLIVEAFSAVRGRLLGGKLSGGRADDAVDSLAEAAIELLPVRPLLQRMWALRPNVSAYDAAYVAAAESQGCALVTADRRLTLAPQLGCEVRLAC